MPANCGNVNRPFGNMPYHTGVSMGWTLPTYDDTVWVDNSDREMTGR
jgi:hypothetical protein